MSKHTNDRIESGQLKQEFMLPIWITNSGIESQNVKVTFEELPAMLKELVSIADRLATLNFSDQRGDDETDE